MRKAFFAVVLLTHLVTVPHAQTVRESRLLLSLVADSVETKPVFGYDGILREGPAQNIVTTAGKAVIRINDIEMTADRAAWRWGSREIELTSGNVSLWVGLPSAPNAYHFEQRYR
jgi:hypothetical protein